MYISAVIYPMSLIAEKIPEYAWLVRYNPLAYVIETTRHMLLGIGEVPVFGMIYTVVITVVLFIVGILLFNRTEKSFIDTV